MRFTAIAALLLAAVASAQSSSFSNCVTAAADMTVTSFSLSPDPVCVGQNYCINVTGTLSAPVVTGAKLVVTGRWSGHIVYTDNQDFCTVLAASGRPCPVPITTTSLSLCVLMKPTYPANVPLALTILATNGNGNVLFCQAATVIPQNCS
ncbi:hypothetical protein BC939DRAFT_499901 [Gamsiella multidivaricata]|uniref:uncharacterized protein n=1 Tax=Gamsiella multidivaricata TaxID=101098 RepID=UPI00221FEC6D|nr:uncharacterized protein BC939DRAFT_499901 [Gamsiella multidivaricata]KAG0361810.1 hypothetical protein BGZ54_008934 [Gamsiella multidivaricata]KAI7829779.1 hypothetical protein BC939DRAFT_499901 [Gamsiella multidivaricata]